MAPVPLTEQEIAELLATATDAHLCGTPMPADSALAVMRVLGELDRQRTAIAAGLVAIDWEERCAAAERARDDARDLAAWLLRDWPSPATPVSVTVAEATIERWRTWGWRPAHEEGDQAQGGDVPSPHADAGGPRVGEGTSSGGDSASSPHAPSTPPRGGRVALAGVDDPRPWAETAGAPPPAPAVHHERIPEHEVALQRDTLLATCHHLRHLADRPIHAAVLRAILDETLDVIEGPQ